MWCFYRVSLRYFNIFSSITVKCKYIQSKVCIYFFNIQCTHTLKFKRFNESLLFKKAENLKQKWIHENYVGSTDGIHIYGLFVW